MGGEIFTRLNPGAVDHSRIRVDGGGAEGIRPCDLAHALKDQKDKYYWAVQIGLCGDYSRKKYMADLLLNDIAKVAMDEGWKTEKGKLLAMCRMAVAELYTPSMLNTARQRMRFLGIQKSTYYETYHRYYEIVYAELVNIKREWIVTGKPHPLAR